MKKSYRVRKNEEFTRIINQRHVFTCPSFIIYVANRALDNSRVGLSVSKKLGDAVTRNKIKRQVRMMFLQVHDFNTCPLDIICIVKKKYLEETFIDNQKQLEKLIKKAII